MRGIFNPLVYILFEIISFLILMPVNLISCTVLLLTGKFSAFALRTRKATTNSGSKGLIERIRSFFHRGHHLVPVSPYPAITSEDQVL